MTPTPSTRVVTGTFWASVGLNALAATAHLLNRAYGLAGVGSLVIAALFMVRAMFSWLEAWSTAVRREAEAKASFAETLLWKFRQAEGISVRMNVPGDDLGGTKH